MEPNSQRPPPYPAEPNIHVNAPAPIINTVNMPNIPITIPTFSADIDENIIDWFENFEFAAQTLNWSEAEKFQRLPTYLQNTARRWYTMNLNPNIPEADRPRDYVTLKSYMIRDLCPADYRSYLSQQLNNSAQQPGQSSTSFIYEIQELCLRIDESTPEIFILSIIKEKLLPQIKYGIALQNPQSIQELVAAARLAERAMHICNNPFNVPTTQSTNTINKLQEKLNQLTLKVDSLTEKATRDNMARQRYRDSRYNNYPNFMNSQPYYANPSNLTYPNSVPLQPTPQN